MVEASSIGRGRQLRLTVLAFVGMLCSPVVGSAAMLDLTKAVVIVPDDLSRRESRAVAMLIDEVEHRTGVRWEIATNWPKPPGSPVVAVGREPGLSAKVARVATLLPERANPDRPEGYRIGIGKNEHAVIVAGNDERGVLFGVGRMLREMRMSRGRVLIDDGFHVKTAPEVALRGHQLGYRPKTNSYDGWDLPQWEQYIKDLAVFGTNAIELLPPRSDDDAESPHFPRPPIEMMVGMSKLADDYGLDVWVWFPAMDKDYANPATVEFAIREWSEVLHRLPRVDAVFVPGGDPGHTRPKDLMALLERQSESLRKSHPKLQMWVSPQGFTKIWHDEFLAILRKEPKWLTGVVFGPQVRVGLGELRASIPSRYPIRNYPDITHTLNCQYPVPDWDLAFALTHDREPINPCPLGQAAIFQATRADSIGFLSYSEGCNDDVNKFVWSGLGWDSKTPVIDILRQYARYFLGDRYTDDFAQGLLALERNWRGPLVTNAGVETTLAQFRGMERSASPRDLGNWRFQQALYRAYYDAYVRDRLIRETTAEAEATEALRQATRIGAIPAMASAETILDRASREIPSVDRRTRVFELAEALFQSIRMQLSVRKQGEFGRGTTLDTIDVPLNSRVWLIARIAAIRALGREEDRVRAITELVDRTDPGPGGFYDNLGDPTQQTHLVRGAEFAASPDFRQSWVIGFDDRPGLPMVWLRNAQSLYDEPLRMHYESLDPAARYRLRVVYSGDNFRPTVRLEAEGVEIHPYRKKPDPITPLEFEIPASVTADGKLDLRFNVEPGRGGNGRGCQVSEVWLIKSR
jgi:hypothetical protein